MDVQEQDELLGGPEDSDRKGSWAFLISCGSKQSCGMVEYPSRPRGRDNKLKWPHVRQMWWYYWWIPWSAGNLWPGMGLEIVQEMCHLGVWLPPLAACVVRLECDHASQITKSLFWLYLVSAPQPHEETTWRSYWGRAREESRRKEEGHFSRVLRRSALSVAGAVIWTDYFAIYMEQ